MKTQTLVIDKELCALNKFIAANNQNRYIAAKIKKNETYYCALMSKNQLKPVLNYPIDVTIEWHTNGRKDPDNISFAAKFLIDGLQDANIIINDGFKQINSITHTFIKNKKESCVVTIEEKED